jgi:hypothetical protein
MERVVHDSRQGAGSASGRPRSTRRIAGTGRRSRSGSRRQHSGWSRRNRAATAAGVSGSNGSWRERATTAATGGSIGTRCRRECIWSRWRIW